MKAFILIACEQSKVIQYAKSVATIKWVKNVEILWGEYDLILTTSELGVHSMESHLKELEEMLDPKIKVKVLARVD